MSVMTGNNDCILVSKPGFMARLSPARDECLIDNGGCEQICVYKLNSHHCKCEPGYELKLDKT